MAEYSIPEIVTPKNYGEKFIEYVNFVNEAIDLAHRTHSLRQVMDGIASGQEQAILAAIDDWLVKKKEYEKQEGYNLSYSAIQLPQLDIGVALLEALGIPSSPDLNNYKQERKPKLKKVENPKVGFVYLMLNKRNQYVKIGWSKNPTYREETLQAEDPDIELLHKFSATFSDEKAIHQKYSEFRIRGEWFRLNEVHIRQIIGWFEGKNA